METEVTSDHTQIVTAEPDDVIAGVEFRDADEFARGTARYWSKQCGVQTFAVTGNVSAGERTVTLSGEAPKLDASCTVTGRSSQSLVFDRQ